MEGSSIWLVIIAGAVALGVLFLIPLLLELRRTVRTLTGVLQTTEEQLVPTLRELRSTLANLDRITADVSTVTDDVRVFSGSLRQVGKDVQELSGLLSALGGGFGARVHGLRAGINAGLGYLTKNMLKRGGVS